MDFESSEKMKQPGKSIFIHIMNDEYSSEDFENVKSVAQPERRILMNLFKGDVWDVKSFE